MTKIEKYKKEKSDHGNMVHSAYTAMNEGSYKRSDRDKYGLAIGSRWHDRGESMGYLTGYSGYYGSSGCTYQCTERLAKYLIRAINKNMKSLVDQAVEMSLLEVEKHRKDAEEEAKAVLNITTP